MDVLRKVFPFTLTKIAASTGGFEGYAATFGNVDQQGDVIIVGAFAMTLPKYLEVGFISDAHDWEDPIGYPVEAHEDPRGLWLIGTFHSTERAQRIRTIAAERLAAAKAMGLSIGFRIPAGGATVRSDGVRELRELELVEVALTLTPANEEALVTSVKRAQLSDAEFQRRLRIILDRQQLYAARATFDEISGKLGAA